METQGESVYRPDGRSDTRGCQRGLLIALSQAGRNHRAAEIASSGSHESMVFAGGVEPDFRPALFGEAQVDAGRRQVGKMPAAIDGEVVGGLVAEFLELLPVARFHPACRPDVDWLIH